MAIDIPVPAAGAQGKPTAEITLTPIRDNAVIYEMRMMTTEDSAPITPVTA